MNRIFEQILKDSSKNAYQNPLNLKIFLTKYDNNVKKMLRLTLRIKIIEINY